jgi:hypothetical protein
MWNRISCYVTGHDYSVCCDGGAMFLRCVVCNRRSHGWVVHGTQDQAPSNTHQHSHAHAPAHAQVASTRA